MLLTESPHSFQLDPFMPCSENSEERTQGKMKHDKCCSDNNECFRLILSLCCCDHDLKYFLVNICQFLKYDEISKSLTS